MRCSGQRSYSISESSDSSRPGDGLSGLGYLMSSLIMPWSKYRASTLNGPRLRPPTSFTTHHSFIPDISHSKLYNLCNKRTFLKQTNIYDSSFMGLSVTYKISLLSFYFQRHHPYEVKYTASEVSCWGFNVTILVKGGREITSRQPFGQIFKFHLYPFLEIVISSNNKCNGVPNHNSTVQRNVDRHWWCYSDRNYCCKEDDSSYVSVQVKEYLEVNKEELSRIHLSILKIKREKYCIVILVQK